MIGNGEPIFVNAGLAKMLGYDSLEEFVASCNVNFAHNTTARSRYRREGSPAPSRKRAPPKYEVRFRRKTGDYFWVEIAGAMGMWDGKNVSISWISDISERKKAEEALIQARRTAEPANKSKSAFLRLDQPRDQDAAKRRTGHGAGSAAQPMPADQLEMVNTIAELGKVLMALLNDVLDISKIEAGKLEISRVEDDLRASLGRVKSCSCRSPGKKAGLDFTFDETVPPSLLLDPVRVRQCVSNLVSNALKFTSKGRIAVHASWGEVAGKPMVSIAVTDTGIGISEAAQSQIVRSLRAGGCLDGASVSAERGSGLRSAGDWRA